VLTTTRFVFLMVAMKVFTDNDIEEKQWRAWSYDGFDKSIILVLEPKVLTRCPCIAFHLLLSREHLSWTGSKRTVYENFFFFYSSKPHILKSKLYEFRWASKTLAVLDSYTLLIEKSHYIIFSFLLFDCIFECFGMELACHF
jgi:hypothetical protein